VHATVHTARAPLRRAGTCSPRGHPAPRASRRTASRIVVHGARPGGAHLAHIGPSARGPVRLAPVAASKGVAMFPNRYDRTSTSSWWTVRSKGHGRRSPSTVSSHMVTEHGSGVRGGADVDAPRLARTRPGRREARSRSSCDPPGARTSRRSLGEASSSRPASCPSPAPGAPSVPPGEDLRPDGRPIARRPGPPPSRAPRPAWSQAPSSWHTKVRPAIRVPAWRTAPSPWPFQAHGG